MKGVKIRALAEINDNSFFGGISRVQFFINGVTLDAVGGQGTSFADGLAGICDGLEARAGRNL